MKLKSLLIGSAAVLTAVSTARAADAIIVEPEPVDYVRVCDMYGTGFFYIPGTETCINFNGYVRSTYANGDYTREIEGVAAFVNNYANSEVRFLLPITSSNFFPVATTGGGTVTFSSTAVAPGHLNFQTANGGVTTLFSTTSTNGAIVTNRVAIRVGGGGDIDRSWDAWNYRARLNIDVRNETEYGTLRSQIRFQAGDTNDQDGNVAVDRALISLAGFRLGYSDTYWTTNHGYGAGTPAINDGFYNYDQAIFFDYTWTGDNFAVTVGVQDSDSGAPNFVGNTAGGNGGYADFYAGFNWASEWGTFAFTAIQDTSARRLDTAFGLFWHYDREESWAFKASAIIPLADSGWTVGGWYAWADSPYNKYVTGAGGINPGTDYEWGVQVNGALSDNLRAYALYSAAAGDRDFTDVTGFLPAVGLGGAWIENQAQHWAVGVIWTPVTQLSVQVEYASTETESTFSIPTVGQIGSVTDTNSGFYVRVTRSF